VQDETSFPAVEHIYILLMLLLQAFMNSVFVAAYKSVDTSMEIIYVLLTIFVVMRIY
jgi:hypothetical protein